MKLKFLKIISCHEKKLFSKPTPNFSPNLEVQKEGWSWKLPHASVRVN